MANIARTCGLLIAAGLALSACEDLPKLEGDICGNGVIEKGEDCDGVGLGENACNALCRLECTADRACPTSFGCGSDGLCRQPTGAFEPFGPALGLSAERLSLADFDGDGQSDLLASRGSSFSVAYVGPQGLLPETTSISYAPIDVYSDVPAVLDIDGDGRVDLASRLGPSVGVLRGQQNRTLLPLPFAWKVPGLMDKDVLFLADTDKYDAPGPELYALRPDGLYLLFTRKAQGAGQLPKKVYSYSHGGELPHVTPANVSGGTAQGAGSALVFAWDGDAKIGVFAPYVVVSDPVDQSVTIELNVDGALAPPVEVALPAGAKVKGPVYAGRMADQNYGGDDLVIPGTQGGADKLFVTFTESGGGLGSIPGQFGGTADGAAREVVRYVDGKITTKLPLAVGYLGQNDRLDFVDPDGIHLTGCQLEPVVACPYAFDSVNATPETPIIAAYSTAAAPETASGWTGALVVTGSDIFETSFGQVITTSAEPGFTFFKRAPGNALNAFRVQTQSAVLHPKTGDFNGDGSPDLVFSQISTRATAESPDLESLHVAFGDPFGIPQDLADLGDVGKVDSIFAARIVDALTASGVSGLSDALVRSTGKAAPEYYLFAGSTDGTLQSALSLSAQCTGAKAPKGIPRFLTLARGAAGAPARLSALFRADSGPAKYDYHLWSAALSADGSADVCKTLVGPADVTAASGADIAMAAVDLDGDGADETLLLPKGGAGGATLSVAREGKAGWTVDKVVLDAPATGLTLVDLGRKSAAGAPLIDVAVVTGAGVTILWNDGTGKLDATKATVVTIEGIEYEAKKGKTVRATSPLGVAAVGASAKEGRALAIVTAEDTFVVDVEDLKGRKYGVPVRKSPAFGGGGSAVTAGDINGDGVDDLVIARPGGIQIFSGVPVVQ